MANAKAILWNHSTFQLFFQLLPKRIVVLHLATIVHIKLSSSKRIEKGILKLRDTPIVRTIIISISESAIPIIVRYRDYVVRIILLHPFVVHIVIGCPKQTKNLIVYVSIGR